MVLFLEMALSRAINLQNGPDSFLEHEIAKMVKFIGQEIDKMVNKSLMGVSPIIFFLSFIFLFALIFHKTTLPRI